MHVPFNLNPEPPDRDSPKENPSCIMTSETSEKEQKGALPPPEMVEENTADDLLANLGYKPELNRNRSTLQVAFMSFVLASIPWGLSTTVTYPIIGGGPVNIIWGWLAVSLIILCVAASLGEITSVYPTAGGMSSGTV